MWVLNESFTYLNGLGDQAVLSCVYLQKIPHFIFFYAKCTPLEGKIKKYRGKIKRFRGKLNCIKDGY